ncbi:putative inorganic phosphate cotransporter [Battus philenor]|uniref:putative inorganic phosphate cotransporter n=1 Tax=Battus philenor TaxID=42288 RepID=UPI0035CF0124
MTDSEYKKVPVDEKPEKNAELHYGYGVRHIQALLLLFSLCIGYTARAHLGVTVVAMTSQPRHSNTSGCQGIDIVNASQLNGYALCNGTTLEESSQMYRVYNWPKSKQEMVLGSFFVGYGVTMLPAGLACQKWGGKVPLQVALFVSGVMSILAPWLTAWGNWKALAACRLIQGVSQAGYYPGTHTMLVQWVPLSERGSLSSYVYTGSLLGTVAAFQIGGILGASRWGWPSTFWVTGVLCLIMFTLLTVFGAASPSQHKSISDDEKNFILGRIDDGVKRKPAMPWRSILRSRHVWASVASHMGCGVLFVFFFTQVATYMHAILKVDIRNSGLLSSMPYIASIFSVALGGYFSDFLINRKILTIKSARIISNTIGSVAAGLATAAVSFTTNVTLAVTCFVVALMTQGLCHTGWMINYMDLAPNFSGGLMAIGNTVTNVFVMLMPILVSKVVTDVTNVYQWRVLMFTIVALVLVTNFIFVFFMSSETQPWNDGEIKETQKDAKKMDDMSK